MTVEVQSLNDVRERIARIFEVELHAGTNKARQYQNVRPVFETLVQLVRVVGANSTFHQTGGTRPLNRDQ